MPGSTIVDVERWQIRQDDLSSPQIEALLQMHAAEMLENSPVGACHFLPIHGLRDPAVTVWSAWDGKGLAGCGALKALDRHHGEVKSMRTASDYLGRGVGRAVLDHIVRAARARGYERLSLETGTGEPFAAAVHLYEGFGFVACGPFSDYVDNGFSRFFTLRL